jgi:hypothetical protein
MKTQQEKCYRCPGTYHRAGDHKVNSSDKKNECQNLVEEPSAAQRKQETVYNLRAAGVGAPPSVGGVVPTDHKKEKLQYAFRLVRTNSLKEGAMWHVCRKPEL